MPWAGGLPLALAGSQVPAVHSGCSVPVPGRAVDGLGERSLRDAGGTPVLRGLLGAVRPQPTVAEKLPEGLLLLSQYIPLGHRDGS